MSAILLLVKSQDSAVSSKQNCVTRGHWQDNVLIASLGSLDLNVGLYLAAGSQLVSDLKSQEDVALHLVLIPLANISLMEVHRHLLLRELLPISSTLLGQLFLLLDQSSTSVCFESFVGDLTVAAVRLLRSPRTIGLGQVVVSSRVTVSEFMFGLQQTDLNIFILHLQDFNQFCLLYLLSNNELRGEVAHYILVNSDQPLTAMVLVPCLQNCSFVSLICLLELKAFSLKRGDKRSRYFQ